MSILVTGATGQIGRRTVPYLLAAGEKVRILVRDPDAPIAAALAARGAEQAVGDLTDPASLERAADGVSAIVNIAAFFRGPDATDAAMTAVNTDGALALARAGLAAGVPRYVFTSTVLLYGNGHAAPQAEDDEPRPLTWYNPGYPASKAAAEQRLRDLHATQGLDLRILRLAYVYGDDDPHLHESVKLLTTVHPADRLPMVHHVDVAQAVLRAVRTEGVGGRTYNVADDAPVTAAEILWLNGLQPAPDGLSRTQGDPFFGAVRTERIRRELGYRPIFPTVYAARDAGAL